MNVLLARLLGSTHAAVAAHRVKPREALCWRTACAQACPVGARRMACDRAASREARKAVRELLLDRGVPISPSCPLHPDNDRLLPHESRKNMLSRAQWQCAEARTAPPRSAP